MQETISMRAAAVLATMVLSTSSANASSICGDVNDSNTINTTDALLVLKKGVGQQIELQCSPPGQFPATGQTTCYNKTGAVIACAGTGQDGEFQKGVPRSFTDNGDGTVTDNVTELMWEKLSDDGSIHDWADRYKWDDAFAVKIAALNTTNFAGYNDWRLPNLFELQSLINAEVVGAATYGAFWNNYSAGCNVMTCSLVHSTGYWTSTTFKDRESGAWVVEFFDGDTDAGYGKTDTAAVRAVRAGS